MEEFAPRLLHELEHIHTLMMDSPLAFGGLIMALVMAVALFKLCARDENAFEKAKAENKLAPSIGKAVEEKKKAKKRPAGDKKKESLSDSSSSASTLDEEASSPPSPVQNKKKAKMVEKAVEAKKSPSPSAAKKPSTPVVPSPAKEDDEPAGEFVVARPKNKKKNKAAPASSSSSPSAAWKEEKEESSEDLSIASTAPSNSSSNITDLKKLDSEKVLARFAGIEEFEPEYIAFLSSYFLDSSSLLSKVYEATCAADEAKANAQKLEADLAGHEKVMEQLALKLGERSSEVDRLRKELETASASVVIVPSLSPSSCPLGQSPVLLAEIDKLKAELRASEERNLSTQDHMLTLQSQFEMLKSEARSNQQRSEELEEILRLSIESTALERKQMQQSMMLQKSMEDEVVGKDVLLAEAKQNLKAIGDRLTEIETKSSHQARTITSLNEVLERQEKMHESAIQTLMEIIEDLKEETSSELTSKDAEIEQKNAALSTALEQINEMQARCAAASDAEARISALRKTRQEERHLVVSTLGDVMFPSAPAPPANIDAKSYKSWLSSMAAQLKEAQSQSKAPAPKKETKKASTDSGELEPLRAENENYMLALAEVTDELGNIATLHAEREASYAACAAELQALKGGKRPPLPPSPLAAGDSPPPSSATPSPRPSTGISPTQSRLLDELRACQDIKMQIASLRAAIDTVPCPSEAPSLSSPPTGSEDDGKN